MLQEETGFIQQKFPRDRKVVAGDFNANTSNSLDVTPELF